MAENTQNTFDIPDEDLDKFLNSDFENTEETDEESSEESIENSFEEESDIDESLPSEDEDVVDVAEDDEEEFKF